MSILEQSPKRSSLGERQRPLVLVADDDVFMQELFGSVLMDAGFDVDVVPDGKAAISRFFEISPDMAILDILMPEVDGYDACMAIRRSVKGQSTPIIMATGLEDSDSIARAFDVGATHFVTKPINWKLFEHEISYLWRANRALKEIERYSRRIKELEGALRQAQGSSTAASSVRSASLDDIITNLNSIKFIGESVVHGLNKQDSAKAASKIGAMIELANKVSASLKPR